MYNCGHRGHRRVVSPQMEYSRIINTFLEADNLASLSHAEIQNLNRPKQKPKPGICSTEHGKEDFSNLFVTFQTIDEEGTLPNSSHESSLTAKAEEDATRK